MQPKRIFVNGLPATRAYVPGRVLVYAGGTDLTGGSLPGGWSITRASSAWRWDSGTIGSVTTDVARFADDPRTDAGLGLMLEPAATNLVSVDDHRDLSGWTSPDATYAAATGIDGTSSASRLTATDDNAVVSLALTATIDQYVFSLWMRRVTGLGGIRIALDGGANGLTSLNVAPHLLDANGWVRVHWTHSIANPTLAIVIDKDGDAIDVDFCQCEVGTAPTSEITGGATRAAETLTLPLYGALIYADIIAQYPVIGLDRRCVIDRIVDHASKPVITFAAQRSPLGGFIELPEFSVELS